MELFFVSEDANIKYVCKGDLTVGLELWALDNKSYQNKSIPPGKLYFTKKDFLPLLIDILKKNNQAHIIKIFNEKQNMFPEFLAKRDIWKNEKINLPGKGFRISIIFDILSSFEPDFITSFAKGLNYFYENLKEYFPNLQIDIFTTYFSELLDIAEQLPVSGILFLPSTIDILTSYDAYLNLSDIVKNNNFIDFAKIDICLGKLCVNFTLNRPVVLSDQLRENLVSIILTTCNRQNYLPQAVESVLNQTYKNIELLIVDDGSTDNTRDIVSKYLSDKRIKYFYQENQGVCLARNNGIKNANGNYLMFLDDDDIFFPYAVEKLLSSMKKQPENVKLVYGDLIYLYEKNKELHKEKQVFPKPKLLIGYVVGWAFSTIGLVMVKTQAIKDIGMFDKNYEYSEDFELLSRIVFNYDIAKIDIPIILYRRHESQKTADKAKVRYYSDKIALKFWYLLRANNIQLHDSPKRTPAMNENRLIAHNYDYMAFRALNSYVANYDMTLELLKLAQETYNNDERQKYIDDLSVNIPIFIREKYNSDLRVTEAEKELLKQQANFTKIVSGKE
jgi:glycosyltransferase involved in cell wall biosynthesis